MNATKKARLAALLAAGPLLVLSISPGPRPTRLAAQPAPRADSPREAGPDVERRLRAVELKLDRLLADWEHVRRAEPAASPDDEENRVKSAIWARLVRDGFLGRYDTADITPDRLAVRLYRRYLGRRPTGEEVAEWLRPSGPGGDRFALPPEVILRRRLGREGVPDSPLDAAILRASDPDRMPTPPEPPAAPAAPR
jgi:hypothetical protein